MSARKKLNSAYVCGSLVMAGACGLFVGSWWVFIVVLGVLLACNFYEGNIRSKRDSELR
jgi:hypothetical protein